jgi:hypothetical protein
VDAYKTDLKIAQSLCEEAKTAVAKGIRLLKVESGNVIYREGDDVDGLCICLTAQIELQHSAGGGSARLHRSSHDVIRMFGRRSSLGSFSRSQSMADDAANAKNSAGDARHSPMSSHTHALRSLMRKNSISTIHSGAQHSPSDRAHRADTQHQHLAAGSVFGFECLVSERSAQDHTALVTRSGYVLKINARDYRHARMLEAQTAIESRMHAIRSALQVGDRAPTEVLSKLAVCMEEQSYEMGHFLARQGHRPEMLYIVLSGPCLSSIDVGVRHTTSPQQPLLPAIRTRMMYTDKFDEKPSLSETPRRHAMFSHKQIVLANTECWECVGLVDALLRQDKCIATVGGKASTALMLVTLMSER